MNKIKINLAKLKEILMKLVPELLKDTEQKPEVEKNTLPKAES